MIWIAAVIIVICAMAWLVFRRPKTVGSDREAQLFELWMRQNPGNDRMFAHCGRIWKTSNKVPPAIVCPSCHKAVVGIELK